MFYMKAQRNYNGCLQFETLAGFVDNSNVLDESDFLTACKDVINQDGNVYGIVSTDVHSVLLAAY